MPKTKPHPLTQHGPSGRYVVAVCEKPAPGRDTPQLSIVAEEVHLARNLNAIRTALANGAKPTLWAAVRSADSYNDALQFRRDLALQFDELKRQQQQTAPQR